MACWRTRTSHLALRPGEAEREQTATERRPVPAQDALTALPPPGLDHLSTPSAWTLYASSAESEGQLPVLNRSFPHRWWNQHLLSQVHFGSPRRAGLSTTHSRDSLETPCFPAQPLQTGPGGFVSLQLHTRLARPPCPALTASLAITVQLLCKISTLLPSGPPTTFFPWCSPHQAPPPLLAAAGLL